MTLDDLDLFAPGDLRPGAAPRRKCRRHEWTVPLHTLDDGPTPLRLALPKERVDGWQCARCGAVKDHAVSRRSKSSSRLGKDQERRIERVYGPRKVGEFGDAVDHLGRDFKWQAKASRHEPPAWLAAITEPTSVPSLPLSILGPMARMRALGGTRSELLIRCYVRQGKPTRDWLFVTAWDWGELHGWPTILGYVVIPGASFLDIHGRDEESA